MFWATRALHLFEQHDDVFSRQVGPGGPCPKGLADAIVLADGEARNSNSTWDRGLELSLLNVESLVSAVHQAALNTSLVFVHTARRFYR